MHLLIPALVTLLATVFLTPLKELTPFVVQCTILGLILLAIGWYAVAIFAERPRDEREVQIRAFAHRLAYLVGMSGLVLIMGYRLLTDGYLYPETIILLVVLVATKSFAHWYGQRHF